MTPVVLANSKDWDDWLELIKTASMVSKTWPYINPNTPKNKLPVLVEPPKPTPESVFCIHSGSSQSSSTLTSALNTPTGRIITLTDLTDRELLEYKVLQSEWLLEREEFQKKEEALCQMRVKIQETVARNLLVYTFKCETAYDMLVRLKNRLAPTDIAREQELILEWEKLQWQEKGQDVDTWLQKWDTVYQKCLDQQIPDVQGLRPIYSFLTAVHSVGSGFTDVWQVKMLDGGDYDFNEVVQKFRDYRRITQGQEKPQS